MSEATARQVLNAIYHLELATRASIAMDPNSKELHALLEEAIRVSNRYPAPPPRHLHPGELPDHV